MTRESKVEVELLIVVFAHSMLVVVCASKIMHTHAHTHAHTHTHTHTHTHAHSTQLVRTPNDWFAVLYLSFIFLWLFSNSFSVFPYSIVNLLFLAVEYFSGQSV